MSAEIDRKIAVIFVADVVGYSKHMEKDENATIKNYNTCEKILYKLLKKYKGSVFNTAGDSVLAEFPSAVNAVECGVDFQNSIKKRNELDSTEVKLEFRLGINMGDVVKKEGNLIGDGVNIAARLEAFAQPNGISISKSVYDFVIPKTKMTFNDLGVQKVKQNEFHAFDILLEPSQKRTLKKKSKSNFLILGGVSIIVLIAIFIITISPYGIKNLEYTDNLNNYEADVLGRTLLILPFETNSSENDDYIASGITDHLRSTLPATVLLNIVPRQKSENIQEEKLEPDYLKRELDVSYVLSGRISVAGEKFRLSLELLDLHEDSILMATNLEFATDNMFSAQDEVERVTRKEIQSKLTMGSVLSSEYNKNFSESEQYKRILRLRVEENKMQPSKTYEEMEVEYKKIYEKRKNNPLAAFLYAKSINMKIRSGESKDRIDDAQRIKKILDEAILLNPESAVLQSFRSLIHEAYYAIYGFRPLIQRGKNKEAVKKAVLLEPENHDVLYWSSKFYAAIGNSKKAAPLIEKAILIAPFGSDERKAFLCRVYLGGFDFEKAEETAKELIILGDKRSVFIGSMFMAFIEAKTNRLSQAKNTFQKILDSEQITKQQAIAQFRKYFSDRDPYYSFEFYNVLESLKNN